MQYFLPLSPADMTETDVRWLAKMDEISYDGTTGADLLQEVLRGTKMIWRIAGGLEGIAVTSVKKAIFQIEFVAGRNLIKNLSILHDELLSLAAQENCNQVECVTKFAALQRVYRRLGYKPIALVMRIDHGR